jgi:hypothetical protein
MRAGKLLLAPGAWATVLKVKICFTGLTEGKLEKF